MTKTTDKQLDIKSSPMILEGQYAPRVHIIGEDNLVARDFRLYGYKVMPRETSNDFAWSDTDLAVFTGGGDIHPKFYGEPFNGANKGSIDRDESEIEWFHLYDGIPKVGICRGMQLLNILSGGRLIQHVQGHHKWHDMEDIWGTKLITSSVHHQVCIPPANSKVIGWSNGVSTEYAKEPEVMIFPECQGFGVQGHPEYGPDNFRHYFFLLLKFYVYPWVLQNVAGKLTKNQKTNKVVH